MGARWKIQLFGSLRAECGERAVTRFRPQKAASLLAYLAYFLPHTRPREVLIDLLWPECEPEVARHRLSVALSALRQHLELPERPDGVIVADHFAVGLNPEAVTTDVAEFQAALTAAAQAATADEQTRLLSDAVELYQAELLPGYYEDWIFAEQQRLAELHLHALRQLVAHLEEAGEIDRALQYALRAVRADPLREESHREVMRLYAVAGQPASALRQYHELERLLQQELGEAPSEASRRLADEIRSGVQVFRCSGVQEALRQSVPNARIPEHLNTRTPEHLNTHHPTSPRAAELEPVGGAVPLQSPFYVERPCDEQFRAAIARGDSIVLVKGASQVGKTSLLARGLQQAREAGARVVPTDIQKLNASELENAETFCLTLAERLADALDLDVLPDEVWNPRRGPSANLERYLRREVLGKTEGPIVWGLDEVDRLFERAYGSEIFRLFRSWHNERALDPSGPWARLTLAIAYATEAHLFITDVNQSPFNVGTRLELEDFTPEHVADLNRRYGSPLKDHGEAARFYRLVGGHPHLVRLCLHEMASRGAGIAELESRAGSGEWIFAEHLQRLRVLLVRDPELCAVMRGVLQGQPCPTPESFYRLRSAGVVTGDSPLDARPRCQLYAAYLERHLL